MKIIASLFIVFGLLVPMAAEAKSTPKDKVAPTATAIHIGSSNANPAKAQAGDTVTITFTANEKVTPIVLVETKTLFVKAKNSGGNNWDASYVVNTKDRTGRVDYLLTLVDTAGNVTICSSVRLIIIKYCPPTDGSLVTIYKGTTPPPPPPADTTPPVISAHADVFATTEGTSAVVSYDLPTSTDNKDGAVEVNCAPLSGSTFVLGSTTVNCSAGDAAGNTAQSSFVVGVTQDTPPPPPEPTLYEMAGQTNEDSLCEFTMRGCYTPDIDNGIATIDLGQGSNMGDGALQTVTISSDSAANPWLVSLECYTTAAYNTPCGDWVAPLSGVSSLLDHNSSRLNSFASNPAAGSHVVASFTNPAHNSNFDGSAPVIFNPSYYYRLLINDLGAEATAYGTETEPFWLIVGIH